MTMYLYRKLRWAVTPALALALASGLAAQWRAPRPERKTPRAIAVLESYPDGVRRLVPVTLFYEHRYYDANLYRAAPVPFTLAPQTVYEVQRLGKPLGTFTVRGASRAASAAWIAGGQFKAAPEGPELAEKKQKKPAAPVVVEDPTRPVLHRREGSEGDRAASAKASPKAGESDADRPKLHRRAEEQPPEHAATAEAPGQSRGEEGDHPVLRRGKPSREQSGGELAAVAGEPLRREVAVSDAGTSEPRDLLFAFPEAERKTMESRARELAMSEFERLAALRGLNSPQAAQALAAAKAGNASAGLEVQDEQFVPYDLDYQDYATVVYSARYRLAHGAANPAAKPDSWVVMVVARQDADKLVKLYSAVSDPRELDLYPEVRLVDAVDPDGYGRYALLLREQKREGVSWLLARVTGYELQTVFETAAR